MNASLPDLVDHATILPLMGPVKRSGEWLLGFCPVHRDGSKHNGKGGQSLGLSDAGVLKCFAGCSWKDIIEALRGPSSVRNLNNSPPALVKVYQYRDLAGNVVAEKGRFEAGTQKTFKWRKPGSETWEGGADLKTVSLYGAWMALERPTEPIYVVEGEKAAEACWEQGLLAVTHHGGASVKDFGHTLDILRDRDVLLWPDNDAPGRAHMNLIQARIAGVARSIRFVSVRVPEKGDAWDYFNSGGSVDGIESASPNEPVVTVLAEDAVQIVIPSLAGPVTLTFAEMEKSARALEAEVQIACFQSGERPYSQRMNLLSSSARTELRRDLEALYTKEYGWPAVLNTGLALARETYLRQDRGVDVFDIPDAIGDLMLLNPFLVADGATVFFGDGSSFKSYLAFTMAQCLALGLPFCGYSTPQLPVMVVDYEDSASNFRRRLARIADGLDPGMAPIGVFYWPANGIPLKDQVDAIKRKIEKEGIGFLIIDSAAPACGGPPEDAESALAYFRALKRLGVPSVTIAHVNRSGDTNKPFGSAFWHNEPRRTWYISRVQEDDADEIDVGLFCRKVNDGPRPSPISLHVSFGGRDGPVRVSLGNMADVPELNSQTSTRNQVWNSLQNKSPQTIAELMQNIMQDYKAVDSALRRGPFVQVGTRPDTKGRPSVLWGRRT